MRDGVAISGGLFLMSARGGSSVFMAMALLLGIGMRAEKHSFTVRDSIEMSRFNHFDSDMSHPQIELSPDNSKFLVMTSRGNTETNMLESTLWLFDMRAIRRYLYGGTVGVSPTPQAIVVVAAVPVTKETRAYGAVIDSVQWARDSKHIFFRGQTGAGRRLYVVDVGTKAVRLLSAAGQDVRQYSVGDHVIVYSASCAQGNSPCKRTIPVKTLSNSGGSEDAVTSLLDVLFPNMVYSARPRDLWTIREGHDKKVPRSQSSEALPVRDYYQDVLVPSPDGNYVIQLAPVLEVPKSWEQYRPSIGFEDRSIRVDDPSQIAASNSTRLERYVITRLDTGVETPLVNAPNGVPLVSLDTNQAVWSASGRRALVTNTYLPLDGAIREERERRLHSCAVAVVDVSSRASECIAFSRFSLTPGAEDPKALTLQTAAFGKTDNQVTLRLRSRGNFVTEHYERINGTWNLIDSHPERQTVSQGGSNLGLSIVVREASNTPPALWLVDGDRKIEKQLWDPNPQFSGIEIPKIEVFHWRGPDGYEWTGGLVLPPHIIAGTKYPLVLQTHGFSEGLFLTDGMFPTAMAARPLAGTGIVVLQVQGRQDTAMSANEARSQAIGYEAAIQQLAASGLIDEHRVGIVGFSRTSWHVEEALIEHPGLYAAAVIADGVDQSYMQYLLVTPGDPVDRADSEKIYGGAPFGTGLTKWTGAAPGFHLDKLTTPLRIEASGPLSLLGEWEIYAALKLQHRPVDLVYIPEGQHILQKPWDRLSSQEGVVDWFRFWLQGYEDPNLAKLRQYRRWEAFKKPLGSSVTVGKLIPSSPKR